MSNYYFLWLCTEQWELIYYVAFIVLTIGLVIFAAKTYFFQTKQSTKLFCKSIEKPAASGNSNLYIEVYNYGNSVAQNIGVKIQSVDFGTIPFLKPGEDYLIPVAYFIHASDQKIAFAERIKVTGDTTTIPVVLTMGKTSSEFDVDITIQKNAIKLNESDSRYFEKIGKTLEAIEKQQEKMTGEIKKQKHIFFKPNSLQSFFAKALKNLLQAVIAIYISKCITTVILWHRISV